ncbi:MAG: radical SAM protein [Spirochaetes bacterium]|nr:radical SAM protein [Spirochaetota bacterium]
MIRIDHGTDETSKLLLRTADGLRVESVVLRDRRVGGPLRRTACLSSQVGCAVGCAFCMTGKMSLLRNLTAQEIVEQFIHLRRRFGGIANVVFMGMGEPLHNVEEVLTAIRVLTHPLGPAVPFGRITISTSGATRGIRKLAAMRSFSPRAAGRPRLAVSLITARAELRAALVRASHLQEAGIRGESPGGQLTRLREAIVDYQSGTGQPMTLEVVLLGGVTDTPDDASEVAAFVHGRNSGEAALRGDVNLIRWNPVEDLPFRPPEEAAVNAYAQALIEAGVQVTHRYPRGTSTSAGCGQLGYVAPKQVRRSP